MVDETVKTTEIKHNQALIGVFVDRNKVLSFLEHLKTRFHIKYSRIFVYTVEDNPNEYFLTFNYKTKDILKYLRKANVFHVKNGSIFSINALNLLLDDLRAKGEVDADSNQVDWSNYKDLLIIASEGSYKMKKLMKLNDLSVLLSD